MSIRRASLSIIMLAALLLTGACEAASELPPGQRDASAADKRRQTERPQLGLMTSLPLYWPIGADMKVLAQGQASIPWQREQFERSFELVMLDTLSPIAAMDPKATDVDPLAGLDRLAVIQPRGLSPADNVALDDWVRAGGRLLLVLDPALTGRYPVPLGDPRRPSGTAIIPPVVKRWGLTVIFDETLAHVAHVPFDGDMLPVMLAGEFRAISDDASGCRIRAQGVIASCAIGRGRATLVADASAFEHRVEHRHDGHTHESGEAQMIPRLLDLAFAD